MKNNYSDELNGIISQMLKPLKGITFAAVIEGLSGFKVLAFDEGDVDDENILEILKKVAVKTAQKVNKDGILRPRPNEVGNDIEPFVKDSIVELGFKASVPTTSSGKKKSTGYPDLLFWDKKKRPMYLECKTYNIKNVSTTQRSFYLSPSTDFKVTTTAHHFGICFEIITVGNNGNNHIYKCNSWKILDLSKLEVDVKYEFNSDNRRMYSDELILAEGNIQVL